MDFVVLSCSHGTVFQSVIDRMKDGSLHAKCLGLISNRDDRGCVEKAKKAGLPVNIVEKKEGESREEYDQRIYQAICALQNSDETSNQKPAVRGPDGPSGPERATRNLILACMGWMSLFSPWFVTQWKNRILNVHPALLPKYPGTHAHAEVLKHGDHESGMTIHLIDEGIDTGNILVQKKCPVMPDDTVTSLKKRVQALECEWYPRVLEMIERGELLAQDTTERM